MEVVGVLCTLYSLVEAVCICHGRAIKHCLAPCHCCLVLDLILLCLAKPATLKVWVVEINNGARAIVEPGELEDQFTKVFHKGLGG